MSWKKMPASCTQDKGLILKYLRSVNSNNPKKWVNGLNKHFSGEDIQMASRYMQKFSTLRIIREMQGKTTVSCDFTPGRQDGYCQKHKEQVLLRT